MIDFPSIVLVQPVRIPFEWVAGCLSLHPAVKDSLTSRSEQLVSPVVQGPDPVGVEFRTGIFEDVDRGAIR